ncbi:MAG: peptidylprolyl isomerase [Thiothrix sp.]|nr:peptidylprolyl isomerase [Thiothrix sp.]HPQ95785.1 peptidylprolyl isomerase [Thiolinea sp.]
MQIQDNMVVSLQYTLTDDQGEVLDSTEDGPFAYLHGTSGIIAGLENALTGRSANDTFTVDIPPEDAYGVRDERLTQQVPRSMFAGVDEAALIPGAQFQAQTNAGTEVVTVQSVDDQSVTIDANHPLAGQTLHFDVKVLEVRPATAEEINHGHVHGPGQHHHH